MKLNTKTLLIILVVLVVAFGVTRLTKQGGRSKSLRSELVSIDTAQVSGIEIISPEGVCELVESDEGWKVSLADGTSKLAKQSAVTGLLNSLMTIKPGRLAAKTADKWKDYAVDSAGTRVKIFENEKLKNDIVIGRFGMEGQQSFYTFVRLFAEEEVYTAPNFMGMSIGKTSKDFRESTLVKVENDSLTSIFFDYPDSAFSLTKNVNWYVGDQLADSASVAEYLSGLNYVSSTNFFDPDVTGSPTIRVSFQYSNQADIAVLGYLVEEEMVIKSETNSLESFSDKELFSKLFKRENDFLTTSR